MESQSYLRKQTNASVTKVQTKAKSQAGSSGYCQETPVLHLNKIDQKREGMEGLIKIQNAGPSRVCYFLRQQGFQPEMVAAAADMQCSACVAQHFIHVHHVTHYSTNFHAAKFSPIQSVASADDMFVQSLFWWACSRSNTSLLLIRIGVECRRIFSFCSTCNLKRTTISIGAHWQNGLAERARDTVRYWLQCYDSTMLSIHSPKCWRFEQCVLKPKICSVGRVLHQMF